MKQYEREYFVSRIRSGYYIVKHEGFKLKLLTPTIEDQLAAHEVYLDTYSKSLDDNIKTQDEMYEWMKERGIWTDKDDEKEKGLHKDLDKLRVEIFKHRNQQAMREKIRGYLRKGEEQLTEHVNRKTIFQENTCEGLSLLEKSLELIRRCTFVGDHLCDFDSIDIRNVWYAFYNKICTDSQIRELARSEPWRTSWALREADPTPLFYNSNRELSVDQKNLLVWSKMYDNIYESMECPADDVIDDDDMLDGWLIMQKEKRESEKTKSEAEDMLNKLGNAGEVFLMAGSREDAERIDTMNNINAKMTKKERMAVIQSKGEAGQNDFRDEKLKLRQQFNQQFKDKFRR